MTKLDGQGFLWSFPQKDSVTHGCCFSVWATATTPCWASLNVSANELPVGEHHWWTVVTDTMPPQGPQPPDGSELTDQGQGTAHISSTACVKSTHAEQTRATRQEGMWRSPEQETASQTERPALGEFCPWFIRNNCVALEYGTGKKQSMLTATLIWKGTLTSLVWNTETSSLPPTYGDWYKWQTWGKGKNHSDRGKTILRA